MISCKANIKHPFLLHNGFFLPAPKKAAPPSLPAVRPQSWEAGTASFSAEGFQTLIQSLLGDLVPPGEYARHIAAAAGLREVH